MGWTVSYETLMVQLRTSAQLAGAAVPFRNCRGPQGKTVGGLVGGAMAGFMLALVGGVVGAMVGSVGDTVGLVVGDVGWLVGRPVGDALGQGSQSHTRAPATYISAGQPHDKKACCPMLVTEAGIMTFVRFVQF